MMDLDQNDADSYREGGEWFEALLSNNPTSATIDFPTMTHGWVSHGKDFFFFAL